MKTITTSIVIILLGLLVSCEKTEFKRDISGTWQFEGVGGGLGGIWDTTSNFSHLKIKKDNQYYIYNFDTLKASGRYSISETDATQIPNLEPYFIKFKSTDQVNTEFPLNIDLDVYLIGNDTLVLAPMGYIDGLSYLFKRN